MKLFGYSFIRDYIINEWNEAQTELSYKYYVTDCLRFIIGQDLPTWRELLEELRDRKPAQDGEDIKNTLRDKLNKAMERK